MQLFLLGMRRCKVTAAVVPSPTPHASAQVSSNIWSLSSTSHMQINVYLPAVLAPNLFHFIDLALARQWCINLAFVYTQQLYSEYISPNSINQCHYHNTLRTLLNINLGGS